MVVFYTGSFWWARHDTGRLENKIETCLTPVTPSASLLANYQRAGSAGQVGPEDPGVNHDVTGPGLPPGNRALVDIDQH